MRKISKSVEAMLDELLDVRLKPEPRAYLQKLYQKYLKNGTLSGPDKEDLQDFYDEYCERKKFASPWN